MKLAQFEVCKTLWQDKSCRRSGFFRFEVPVLEHHTNLMQMIREGRVNQKLVRVVYQKDDRHGGSTPLLPVPVRNAMLLKCFQEIKSILGSTLLKEHQYRAYEQALSQDLTIIQGLPGTGKTLIGAFAAVGTVQLRKQRTLIVAKSTSSLVRMLDTLRKSRSLVRVLLHL